MAASETVATTNIAQGVRFAWDFEVFDADGVYRAMPELCEIKVSRSDVLLWLKELEIQAEIDPVTIASNCGIRAFKKPVVSTK